MYPRLANMAAVPAAQAGSASHPRLPGSRMHDRRPTAHRAATARRTVPQFAPPYGARAATDRDPWHGTQNGLWHPVREARPHAGARRHPAPSPARATWHALRRTRRTRRACARPVQRLGRPLPRPQRHDHFVLNVFASTDACVGQGPVCTADAPQRTAAARCTVPHRALPRLLPPSSLRVLSALAPPACPYGAIKRAPATHETGFVATPARPHAGANRPPAPTLARAHGARCDAHGVLGAPAPGAAMRRPPQRTRARRVLQTGAAGTRP